jgi:hypothetical protein
MRRILLPLTLLLVCVPLLLAVTRMTGVLSVGVGGR